MGQIDFNPHGHDADEIILGVDGELHAGSQVVRAGESVDVTFRTVAETRATDTSA
jgi:hypothetical protein